MRGKIDPVHLPVPARLSTYRYRQPAPASRAIAKNREDTGNDSNRSGANNNTCPARDSRAAINRREFRNISISRIAQKSLFFYHRNEGGISASILRTA
jgi:hypothetical protein